MRGLVNGGQAPTWEIHFIDVFAKNEKENLSKAERNAIKVIVEQIKAERLKKIR